MKFICVIELFLCLVSAVCLADEVNKKRLHVGVVFPDKSSIGVSLIPPVGVGWSVSRTPSSVTLTKKGSLVDENSEIEMYLIKPDVPGADLDLYLQVVRSNVVSEYRKGGKYSLVEFNVEKDFARSNCLIGHVLLQYLPSASEGDVRKLSEQYFLSCLSNKFNNVGYEVRYYQRYFYNNGDKELKNKATALFDDVVISE